MLDDIKTIAAMVPERTRSFLLVFAPTALCFVLVAFLLWMAYTYAGAYQLEHLNLEKQQLELSHVLLQHNATLLQNQQLMLDLGKIAFAICMNQATTDIAQDRCLDSGYVPRIGRSP